MRMRKLTVDNPKAARKSEEWQAIQRALGGTSDGLSKLFGGEQLRLYRGAPALLRNKEDAEDVLQGALLSAYRKLASFEGRSWFSTWLTRIVFNAALMSRRRVRARPQLSLDEISDRDVRAPIVCAVDTQLDPEQVFRQAETTHVVQKAKL